MKNLNGAVKEMTERINEQIKTVLELRKDEKLTALWQEQCSRLDGQIEMLSILTGKEYKKQKTVCSKHKKGDLSYEAI